MKKLTGTEKQIEYAESIRASFFEEISHMNPKTLNEKGQRVVEYMKNNIGNSEWWINNKCFGAVQLIQKVAAKHPELLK